MVTAVSLYIKRTCDACIPVLVWVSLTAELDARHYANDGPRKPAVYLHMQVRLQVVIKAAATSTHAGKQQAAWSWIIMIHRAHTIAIIVNAIVGNLSIVHPYISCQVWVVGLDA